MEMLLTVKQTAERLQLRPATVREHLKTGMLQGVKRGRVWRIPESSLTLTENPLAKALAIVEARDARHGPITMREVGINDAASELRAMREEATT